MRVTQENGELERSEAFYELSLARDVPDAATLDEVCRHYPQYCAQLTQFAIDLALDALVGETQPVDSSPVSASVSRAISNFHNQLHAARKTPLSLLAKARAETKVDEQVENPFTKLERQEFRALAKRLDVSTVFLVKMRDRQIACETMTAGFVRYLAEELPFPQDLLTRHFAGSRELKSPTYHKADHKPSDGGRQSFEDAVRSSALTKAQQKRLLSL